MSSLGPPPRRKRRLWLWILVGLLLLCVLLCVAGGIFLSTSAGQEWFEDFATTAAERATEAAQ
jgi:autotransporter translocation and assembly factor TamB